MDTFKDRQVLEDMYKTGTAPWMVCRKWDPTDPRKDSMMPRQEPPRLEKGHRWLPGH